jgi:hypothetical protein
MLLLDCHSSGADRRAACAPDVQTGSPTWAYPSRGSRTALGAYLHMLTDSTFLAAPHFADPFAPQPTRYRGTQ